MRQVSVRVQISETSLPSFPPWLAKVAAFAQVLTHEDILKAVQDQVSALASPAFTASDVLDLYLHRGSFETVLADEGKEQEMDRCYSHTPVARSLLKFWLNEFGTFN